MCGIIGKIWWRHGIDKQVIGYLLINILEIITIFTNILPGLLYIQAMRPSLCTGLKAFFIYRPWGFLYIQAMRLSLYTGHEAFFIYKPWGLLYIQAMRPSLYTVYEAFLYTGHEAFFIQCRSHEAFLIQYRSHEAFFIYRPLGLLYI